MRMIWLPLLVLACGPSAGETTVDPSIPDGGGPDAGRTRSDARPGNPSRDARGSEACDKMDIVFVIDNSGSMAEEQANLAASFPQFIDVLNEFVSAAGTKVDYRVAVTTTGIDLTMDFLGWPLPMENGENGEFQTGENCSIPRRWLERADPGVSDAFSCVAKVGTAGSSYEMPLESLKLALHDRMADTNRGFLRDDALLAVVILTDENDCSREDRKITMRINNRDLCDTTDPKIQPVSAYIDRLDTIKRGRGRWATAVIAGPGPGKCQSSMGVADEATRLKDFVAQAGQNAVFSSICEGNLAGSLREAIQRFSAACDTFPQID
ncbi:MAG: hypothetical protein HY698_12560 [Deltaproteobacteria bacterium]|nr:hypothetical protein [Deltaproteobacteria bacterium]